MPVILNSAFVYDFRASVKDIRVRVRVLVRVRVDVNKPVGH